MNRRHWRARIRHLLIRLGWICPHFWRQEGDGRTCELCDKHEFMWQ